MNNNTLNALFSTRAGAGLSIIRILVGIIFVAHGAQKLFGMFGGYGLEGTGQWMESIGQWMESIGLAPGYLMALLSGSAEFFGGLALVLGLLARPAALALSVTLIVAIFSVHIGNGLFMSNNGYEFALALLAGTVAVMIEGAGRFSLDRLIAR
ncbi:MULTISPECIES: DoxX family protein [Pseudomonas]|uniref:DoxX family protein n=1 Tax=Pseudomonas juntendi TaxID=2666183 RepID=A0A7W2LXZ0_9PSED|nr:MULTISPECIES: DoxX family protein [Pseudomonas]NOY02094.1 DoxX family protein [Gammaproteobacteria bacterium]MBA6133215.1 DoxX family protein [Pseudomonas juntendi]MBA6149109.1 DoxX family protein [Pseudomonas juntendi]MCK2109139.1 DoxX family protein [Pseudomonas juntendi]MCK2116831.1 DoxX family protein [Pseudomonas juntendi]